MPNLLSSLWHASRRGGGGGRGRLLRSANVEARELSCQLRRCLVLYAAGLLRLQLLVGDLLLGSLLLLVRLLVSGLPVDLREGSLASVERARRLCGSVGEARALLG